jgi:hypothetical protein
MHEHVRELRKRLRANGAGDGHLTRVRPPVRHPPVGHRRRGPALVARQQIAARVLQLVRREPARPEKRLTVRRVAYVARERLLAHGGVFCRHLCRVLILNNNNNKKEKMAAAGTPSRRAVEAAGAAHPAASLAAVPGTITNAAVLQELPWLELCPVIRACAKVR